MEKRPPGMLRLGSFLKVQNPDEKVVVSDSILPDEAHQLSGLSTTPPGYALQQHQRWERIFKVVVVKNKGFRQIIC